tara:strand:- start:326 stop:724 length:399 start_codon:yes stop_codon:yes gene_type:complete
MTYSQAQLEAYLDEDLDAGMMSNIEVALREDTQLLNSLSTILSQRETGVHSVGSVWRRASITCPSREAIADGLLGILDDDYKDYIHFHINVVGCRLCQAHLDDLTAQQEVNQELSSARRKRYFESTAGYLKK